MNKNLKKKKGTLNQIHAHYKAGLTLGQKLIHTQKLAYVWKLQTTSSPAAFPSTDTQLSEGGFAGRGGITL